MEKKSLLGNWGELAFKLAFWLLVVNEERYKETGILFCWEGIELPTGFNNN